MKYCKSCDTEKELCFFGKRSASVDGLAAKCKSCQSAYDKKRASLPKRIKARIDYSKTENGKKARSRARLAWAERNSIKKGANIILGNAVKNGSVEKQYFCSVCSIENVIIHGHHDDYSKPLDVRWLCSPCHNQWHAKNGEGINGSSLLAKRDR